MISIDEDYFVYNDKAMVFKFEKFINEPYVEEYDSFKLSVAAKKVHGTAKNGPKLIQANNDFLRYLIKYDRDIKDIKATIAYKFVYKMFVFKYTMDNEDDRISALSPAKYILNLVTSIFNDNEIYRALIQYVRDNMQEEAISKPSDDEDKRANYDKGSTFETKHIEILYRIAVMSRILVPFIIEYIYKHRTVGDEESKDILYNTIKDMFNMCSYDPDNPTAERPDVYSKLCRFISKAIDKTKKTDTGMWDHLKIQGTTIESSKEYNIQTVITNNIPMFNFSKNIMGYISSIIRTSTMNTFRRKDTIRCCILSGGEGHSSSEENTPSEMESFDSYNTQRDEMTLMIRKYATTHDIDIIAKSMGIWNFSPEEIEFYRGNKKYHDLQTMIIYSMFSRYFSGVENIIGGCKRDDWIMLLIIAYKRLKYEHLDDLAEFLVGTKKEFSNRKLSKYVEKLLYDNAYYKEICETKYKDTIGVYKKNDYVREMIATIININYTYSSYGNPLNGMPIEKNEERIVSQVLAYFKTMIV